MRHSLVTAAVLATVATFAPKPAFAQMGADGPTPISLDEAVRQGVKNSPQMVQAVGARRVASAGYRASIGGFLPSLDFGQSTGHSGGNRYIQGIIFPNPTGWTSNQYFSGSLTLFNGGENILAYRSAKASLDAAEQAQILQRYQTELTIKQQYFAVLAYREAIAAAQEQLKEAQQQMAVTEAQLAGGAVSRADSLTSAVAVGTANVALVTAQGNLATANATLTQLVGSDHEVTAVESDTALVPTISLDSSALIQLAMNGPAMQQAQHQVSANKSSWWASLAAYLPSLGVSIASQSNWDSDHFLLGGGSPATSEGLSYGISYSLFDGLRREQNVVQADVNRDNAVANLRNARLTAKGNIVQYLAAFRTAETKVELQQLQIQAAEQSLVAKQIQYRAGAVGLVDVLTAESTLATARQQLIQARFDARTAKAQIESVIGKDLD